MSADQQFALWILGIACGTGVAVYFLHQVGKDS